MLEQCPNKVKSQWENKITNNGDIKFCCLQCIYNSQNNTTATTCICSMSEV